MEWIASSHVLLRKEKTGRPSQQQSIDRLVISPFYDEALGFRSQPAHHLPSIVSLSSCSLSIALGKVRGQLALGAVCEWSTAHKYSGKGLVRMQLHSATVESAQGDDGGASIISWVPWCPGGSMRRFPSRLSPGRRVESMREPWVPSAPTAPSSPPNRHHGCGDFMTSSGILPTPSRSLLLQPCASAFPRSREQESHRRPDHEGLKRVATDQRFHVLAYTPHSPISKILF